MTVSGDDRDVFAAIRDRAFRTMTPGRLGQVNLYLDRRVREAGEQLGPASAGLRTERPSVLVFADDEPLASFGHACRYLLFDPESGELHAELPARFPPWEQLPATLETFYRPVRPVPPELLGGLRDLRP
jgi:hypothetical protein